MSAITYLGAILVQTSLCPLFVWCTIVVCHLDAGGRSLHWLRQALCRRHDAADAEMEGRWKDQKGSVYVVRIDGKDTLAV